MIKIEKTHVDNIVRAVYSARNAMNSWDKSDSNWETDTLGKADLDLAKRLSKAGNDHSKYLRMINVTCDITAPLYWWKQFEQYKVGTTSNSTSSMHKIHVKEFTWEDFSYEHLIPYSECYKRRLIFEAPIEVMARIIETLNYFRALYIKTKDKVYWWQMIQLLPSSYNQKRTVQLNYQVLKSMYFARRNHKLDEWHTFCDWIESLPYSELIIECGRNK